MFWVSISYLPTVNAQTKVKIFLMAGQSNMQGHGSSDGLARILCAKEEISLPDDPNGCYHSLESQEDRLFEVVGDFYGTSATYNAVNARTVAQHMDQNELIDSRLIFPYNPVQEINFNYSRSNGVRSDPGIWSGSLNVGYGYSNNGTSYGPELTFGHYLSQYTQDDIVLIKVAEGGTDLHVMWRSPSMEAALGQMMSPAITPYLPNTSMKF